MKIFNSIILCLVLALSAVSSICKDDPEDVIINGHHSNHNGGNRDLTYYCTAYYYSSSSTLEVNTFGIGNATVTLYDSNDFVVASDTVSGVGREQVVLHVPTKTDIYKVEISSLIYFGEGTFSK